MNIVGKIDHTEATIAYFPMEANNIGFVVPGKGLSLAAISKHLYNINNLVTISLIIIVLIIVVYIFYKKYRKTKLRL